VLKNAEERKKRINSNGKSLCKIWDRIEKIKYPRYWGLNTIREYQQCRKFTQKKKNWGFSSVVEHLPRRQKTLD
jgi:hypothetical protein